MTYLKCSSKFAKEVNDLIAKTQMRPADILVYLFGSHGQDMAIDVSVVDPSSKSCWKKPLAAGEQRERSKRHKYAEDLTKQGILFNPLVFEAFGGILMNIAHQGL